MPRKATKRTKLHPEAPDWYLQEWMRTLGVNQTVLAEACGWNTSTMNGIYHGRTSYYRDILNLIASKLNIQPFELLMPPDRAMAFRRFQEAALTLAHDSEEAASATQQMRGTNTATG